MSSVLQGSYRPVIKGGIFNAITNATRPITAIERLMEAVSPNAFYNSDDRADPPTCHENTRVAVITKIMDWVTHTMDTDAFILWLCNPAAASETDAFILWLHGPAGAGKTAIARRVAELCEAQGLLLASFLFFRSDPKRNTMKPLVANITYSVARVIPITNELIKIAIEADPLILTYSIEVQLTKLVLEPLRFLADQGHFLSGNFPRLVVIDGLDECLDKDGQTNLIQFLASAVVRNQLPLKFLIVSRPEAHIKLAVALASQRTTFSHLELNDDFLPDEDIRRFLTDKLHEIKTCHPFRLGIPSFWPSKQQMDELIRKASGQFIYASLVVRFVKSACDSPMRQLDIVLGLRPPIDHDLPFAELDTLYRFILSRAKQLDLVLLILGVRYTLERHCSVWRLTTMENVLGLEDGDISIYLSPLNSLLKIDPRRHPPITFHHSSFSDFLCNPERSGTDYCIELPKCDSLIAQCMLKMFPRNSSPPRFDPWLCFTELLYYIKKSSWTFELERAIESFSLTDYLGWLDSSSCARFDDDNVQVWYAEFPEKLLNYLKGKGKSDLYEQHSRGYLEYATYCMDNPPTREKFRLMSIIWFVLQKPFASLQQRTKVGSWKRLCGALFGLNGGELEFELNEEAYIIPDPTEYAERRNYHMERREKRVYGDLVETKRFVPEPILSHRIANLAILCMRYLNRGNKDTPTIGNFLHFWATQSQHSPWLWRRRLRVTSMGYQQPTGVYGPKYSFPQSLRRSMQGFHLAAHKSEDVYQEQYIFYGWTLNLLYHTLLKATKSDELVKALSKSFIPPVAYLLFPRRIRRVRKAVDAYLAKFGTSGSNTSTVESSAHTAQLLPQSTLIPFEGGKAESSNMVSPTRRDSVEKSLKRDFDEILDTIYGATGANPETVETMNAVFNQVQKLAEEIRRNKRRRTNDPTEGHD